MKIMLMSLLLTLLLVQGALVEARGGLSDQEVAQEIKYADALIKMGLPDYAEMVLAGIKDEQGAGPLLKRIELKGHLARGQFDEAKRIIAGEPDQDSEKTWSMKLELGDAYYTWGRYPEAQGIYSGLLQKYPDGPSPDMKEFYINSVYKYAQLLILMGNEQEAIKVYKALQKADLDKAVQRQVKAETAELMLKEIQALPADKRAGGVAEIEKICEEILWEQDLWFGKAIVMLAHVKILKGDIDGAVKLVESYRSDLKSIDKSLREQAEESEADLTRWSPMAQCRYLLGAVMHDKAEKLLAEGGHDAEVVELLAGKQAEKKGKREAGALQHFLNVFIGYPATPWAPQAGERAARIEDILTSRFGAKIKKNITPEQMAKVEQLQFREAKLLFNQQQYKEATESYITVLNLFPYSEQAVSALGDMAECYVELKDELYVDLVIRYLAERFCKNETLSEKAGDQLMRIANLYASREPYEKRREIYEVYFDKFPEHPLAPATLFRFGEQHFAREDAEGALGYYLRVVESYQKSALYPRALNRLAMCYNLNGSQIAEIKTLETYVERLEKEERPGHDLVNATYRLATAYRKLGKKYIPNAFNQYVKTLKLLENPEPYQKTEEEKANNHLIMQGAIYYKGYCYSMLDKPANKVEAYRKLAIKTFSELVDEFPKSEFAPIALTQVGTIWITLGDSGQAQQALKRLQADYPDSEEAQNASFMLGKALLEMGRTREATKVFTEMFSGMGDYTATQILTAGRELYKVGEYEIAGLAFDRVLMMSDERGHREPAMLFKGRALIDQEEYSEGIKVLEELLAAYQRSPLTVDASMYLSRAYREDAVKEKDGDQRFDLFNKSVAAINAARTYEQSSGGRAKLDVEVGRIQAIKAEAEARFGDAQRAAEYKGQAIAAYQTLILTGDTDDAAVRPYIEDAYHESIPLMMEIERWEDVESDAETYLEMFPEGKHANDIRNWRNKARVTLSTRRTDTPEQADQTTQE